MHIKMSVFTHSQSTIIEQLLFLFSACSHPEDVASDLTEWVKRHGNTFIKCRRLFFGNILHNTRIIVYNIWRQNWKNWERRILILFTSFRFLIVEEGRRKQRKCLPPSNEMAHNSYNSSLHSYISGYWKGYDDTGSKGLRNALKCYGQCYVLMPLFSIILYIVLHRVNKNKYFLG